MHPHCPHWRLRARALAHGPNADICDLRAEAAFDSLSYWFPRGWATTLDSALATLSRACDPPRLTQRSQSVSTCVPTSRESDFLAVGYQLTPARARDSWSARFRPGPGRRCGERKLNGPSRGRIVQDTAAQLPLPSTLFTPQPSELTCSAERTDHVLPTERATRTFTCRRERANRRS